MPGKSSSNDAASVLVMWLPSTKDVPAVENQAVSTYLQAGSFKSVNYALESRFAVPAVPGARGAIFGPAKGTLGLAVAVVPEGRFLVVDFAQQNGATNAQHSVVSLSQAQQARLRQVGSSFSLGVTTHPLEASLIFAGVAVSLAALVILVPLSIGLARRRRRLAQDALARRTVQGRGRKIARHHAARSQ